MTVTWCLTNNIISGWTTLSRYQGIKVGITIGLLLIHYLVHHWFISWFAIWFNTWLTIGSLFGSTFESPCVHYSVHYLIQHLSHHRFSIWFIIGQFISSSFHADKQTDRRKVKTITHFSAFWRKNVLKIKEEKLETKGKQSNVAAKLPKWAKLSAAKDKEREKLSDKILFEDQQWNLNDLLLCT